MKEILHFMLPEHTNKLYENEAISSISLTREVADKINELVDAYNRLSKIDLEWKQEQEGRIRKGVLYMKDNLINTLHELVGILEHEKFFDKTVEKYAFELEERVNNLLSSETVDKEVIDARFGGDGKLYKTVGEAIRSQYEKLLSYVKNVSKFVNLELGEIENGYINSSGELVESHYTIRTKNFLPLLPFECYLFNPLSEENNIRIFRYSLEGEFEREYLNSSVYRLDAHKLYKITFTRADNLYIGTGDISKFPLYHYKPELPLKPEYFGAISNDETYNNVHAFYAMFEYVKKIAPIVHYANRDVYDLKGINFKFEGVYYMNGGVVLPHIMNGVFNELRLINTDSKGYMLTLNFTKDCYFNNLLIDGNYSASGINLADGHSNCNIKNSIIRHFSFYGIRTNGIGGHELNIVGNKIFQTTYDLFDEMKENNSDGCCLYIADRDTDNLVADNIICYAFGENIILVDAGSIMFNNNHIYNAGCGRINIHNTNGVYNGNFFDLVTLYDSRGGNYFNGNTFLASSDYQNTMIAFEIANYYGRKSYFANNIFKYADGQKFEGFNEDSIILLNNYDIVV